MQGRGFQDTVFACFSIILEKSVELGFVENLGVAENSSSATAPALLYYMPSMALCIFCIQHVLVFQRQGIARR